MAHVDLGSAPARTHRFRPHGACDHTAPVDAVDVIAEIDHPLGQIVDAVTEAGISDNTVIVFSSDNGRGGLSAVRGGSSGPSVGASSLRLGGQHAGPRDRVLAKPAKIPAGVVTEAAVTCHDGYRTFAALAGASDKIPNHRPIDGVDASDFILGESPETGRKAVLFFGPDGEPMSVH